MDTNNPHIHWRLILSISNEKKIIARTALDAFGGQPTVSKYWDDNHVSHIDLLETIDTPPMVLRHTQLLAYPIIQLDT